MAVAAEQSLSLPRAAQALILGVAIAGGAALLAAIGELSGAPASTWLAVAAIAVAVVAADQFMLTLPHGSEDEHFALTDAVWVFAIVLTPRGGPTIAAAAGTLVWHLAQRRPAAKTAFNVGQVALSLTAGELVWALAADPTPIADPATWALALAAAAAVFLVNETGVAAVIALVTGERFAVVAAGSLRVSTLQWFGNVSIGLLAALAWHDHPAGLVLVAVPLGLVYLAYREWVSGLVEREQMEDMARTAEQIARDGDPSARLPMPERPGRLSHLTASLNRMLEHLDRAFGRERDVLRETAGELQGPFDAIRAELELMTRAVNGGHQPRDPQRLEAELERVERVFDAIASMSLAGRPGTVRPGPVLLAPFLVGIGERARDALDSRLVVVAAPDDAVAMIDPAWTERALMQLLQNAAIHGRPDSSVELRVVAAMAGWRFEVSDDGGGVAVGHEEAVFEPFYRLSSGQERSGLGMSLARSIAEAQGGTVGITNRPGIGATFWLRVPD